MGFAAILGWLFIAGAVGLALFKVGRAFVLPWFRKPDRPRRHKRDRRKDELPTRLDRRRGPRREREVAEDFVSQLEKR